MGAVRCDVDGYERSARVIENFLVHSFGGLMRRPGTERMGVIDGGMRGGVRLMGMDVSDERRFIVVFGDGFVEVWRLDGVLAARLDGPWVASDLPGLRWVQCNDVVWVVCGRVAPQRLERHGDDDWRLVPMVFDRSPRDGVIARDGEVWVERDGDGFTMGAEGDLFGEEDLGTHFLYTQCIPERVLAVQQVDSFAGARVLPDLSVPGTQCMACSEFWVEKNGVRYVWTCYKTFLSERDYKGSKVPEDYPEFFFKGWVVSRFGSGDGFNSVAESRSGDGVTRSFLCHEGSWALDTYGDANQRWSGEFALMGADAEEVGLSPQRFEVLHRFWSWNNDWRNFKFSGDCKRPQRLQLRVLSYVYGQSWGRHELRLNAWDYEGEGVVERYGRQGADVYGAVVELGDGRVLCAGGAQRRCYVMDLVHGGGRAVGVERPEGCGWVGGCVLGDGRVFLISGGARCCLLDVESGVETEVVLEGVSDGFFGAAVLLDDGVVLLCPHRATAFYRFDVEALSLVKVVHSGKVVASGAYRLAVRLQDGRVLLCPQVVGAGCAVFDPVKGSLTGCSLVGSATWFPVWRVLLLCDGRVVLFSCFGSGVYEERFDYVCVFDPSGFFVFVVDGSAALNVHGGAERDDGVVVLWCGVAGGVRRVVELDAVRRVLGARVVVEADGWFARWGWCGWRDGGMDLINGLSGEVARWVPGGGVSHAVMGGVRFRAVRMGYVSYGGPGLSYERFLTDVWSRGQFGGRNGWPGAVAMHQGRLWFAGTQAAPQTVWGSVVDDFANFRMGDGADDAIQVTLAAKDRHRIVWMESSNDLLIGSTAQVWRLSGGEGGVVTPDFCRAAVQLRVGSAGVDAEATDGGCVFVQRGGVRVKELGFSFEADGYRAADTTTFAEHVGGVGGFVGLAVQRVPEVRIWGVRADGGLAVLTYNADQRVCAWTRHVLGGGGRVLSVAVMDGVDADEVWLAVARDGVVCLERLVEGCGVFRDGWSRGGDVGVPYESVLVTNGLAFERGMGVLSGGVCVRGRFSASVADGVRVGFNGRLTGLSRSRGDVVDGWLDLTVPGVWSDELVFELRCSGDGDVRFLGMDVNFSK